MSELTIEALIEGGKATAAPPLGPALGPTGLNMGEVIAAINEKTKDYAGMQVPIVIHADTKAKTYEIKVGSPPVSALLKKEAGLEKAASTHETPVGNVTMEQVKKVANMKIDSLYGKDENARMMTVIGTAVSAGISIDGKPAKQVKL